MAVQFNAVGESYSRAGNLLGTAAFTVAMYVRIDTDLNTASAFLMVDDAASAYFYIGTASTDGTTFVVDDGGTNVINTGVSMTVGTWYYVALTYNGTNTGNTYIATLSGGSLANTSGALVDPPTAGVTTRIGNDGFGERLEGSVAHVRIWAAELTSGELETERLSATAVRTSNLTAAYELETANTTDNSGNGNTLTSNGTPTTVAGPLMSGSGAITLGAVTSAGTGTGPVPPDAVTDLAGTAGDTQVVLTWTAPADNGSSITDYIVQYRRA